MSNRKKHPEAWAFFEEHARNIEGEDVGKIAKYRVPKPDKSGDFIYSNCPANLFSLFIAEWYKPSLESPSVIGKVQYIVERFK